MHHHRSGSGAPLVLIHGIGHHWQAWRPVIDLLTADFDVLACDSPGFGQSPPLPEGTVPTVDAYADAFVAFLAEQGLDRPHVAGSSMGGAVALELARRGVVASATALAPIGFWTAAERHFCQFSLAAIPYSPTLLRPALLRATRTGAGRAVLLANMVKRPSAVPHEELEAALRDAFAAPAFVGALHAFDSYTFTGGGDLDGARVTVAWGDADRVLLYGRQAPRARAVLPHARHVTLDAGHLPFHDAPDEVASVIRATAAAG